MDLGIRNRVALVCAASQGLGKAAALGLAREGVHVAICSRDKAALEAAAEEIRKEAPGVTALPVPADLSVADQIPPLVATVTKAMGSIDILVTNAGGPPVGAFDALTDDQWLKGVDLTLMSTVRMIRAVLPGMRARRWGRIVNITSIAAKQPIGDLIVSSSIRPGLLGLTKVLSQQLGREGILMNSVCPGYFLTARQRDISTARAKAAGVSLEEYLKELTKETPLGRVGDPRELADVIVFLSSERASYVTGTAIAVDGGATKGIL